MFEMVESNRYKSLLLFLPYFMNPHTIKYSVTDSLNEKRINVREISSNTLIFCIKT
jgi:hypothetical protein